MKPASLSTIPIVGLAAAVLLASGSAQAQTLNYAEDFESFAPGNLNGQAGWSGENATIESTGIAGLGARSVVIRPDQGATGLGDLNLAIAPSAWTAPEGRFEADVVIANTNYEFEFGLEHAGALWTARVRMASNGEIFVMSQSNGLLIWNKTFVNWTPGVPFRLGLEIEDGYDVRVYKDGQTIYTTSALSLATPPTITRFAVRQSWPGQAGSGGELILDNIVYDTCPLPTNYCPPTANSNSPTGASIFYSGSRYMTANDGGLAVFGAAAGVSCVFIASTTQAQIPFGNGSLCLGPPRKRLGPTQTTSGSNLPFSSGGSVFRDLDLKSGPLTQVTPGSSWNYQLWFRDNAGGGAGTNLSGAVNVIYCP